MDFSKKMQLEYILSEMSVRDVLEADQDFQVGLAAAAEVDPENVIAREACLAKAVQALQREHSLISALSDLRLFEVVMNDVQWKQAIMESLPLGVGGDHLKAIHVLVKCRPFLSDLSLL
jgi:hypothetical protein